MDRWTVSAYLFAILLIRQLVGGAWTFSLRVSSARCCTSPTSCEQVGSCEDLAIGICLRSPDTPVEFLESCSVFFLTGNGSDIIDRQLTLADAFVGSNPDFTTTGYQGGVQIFAGVTVMPDFAPFNDGTIDTIFATVDTLPGSGEVSVAGGGENRRANLTFFISVECSPGYSGDDCLTVNTCSEQITCNLTLGYCNTAGECVCHDGTTQCASIIVQPSSTTFTTGVVVAIVVLAIIIIVVIVITVIIVLCYKKKEKKKAEEIILTGPLDNSPSSTIEPPPVLYSTINKEKKTRRRPPEIPAPYQVPVTERDPETTAIHPTDQAAESHGEEHSMSNGTAVQAARSSSQGLVYAELNLHTKKTAAPPPKPPRPPDISCPQPDEEQPVTYSRVNSNPYSTPRTPSQPANAGEATYYTTVITTLT